MKIEYIFIFESQIEVGDHVNVQMVQTVKKDEEKTCDFSKQ